MPGHVFGDLYRDVPYPGGILNVTFASYWSASRVQEGYVAGPQWYQQTGDQTCLENQADHVPNLAFNPFVQALYNHFDGPLFRERSPFWFAHKITAPTFLIESWQDEQVGSRADQPRRALQRPTSSGRCSPPTVTTASTTATRCSRTSCGSSPTT